MNRKLFYEMCPLLPTSIPDLCQRTTADNCSPEVSLAAPEICMATPTVDSPVFWPGLGAANILDLCQRTTADNFSPEVHLATPTVDSPVVRPPEVHLAAPEFMPTYQRLMPTYRK